VRAVRKHSARSAHRCARKRAPAGKSDVVVSVVFPGATPNAPVGTFYYYTIDTEDGYLNIYGTGLSGASKVKFGDNPSISVASATDARVQVPIQALHDQKIWGRELEVAIEFAADSSVKTTVIGRFNIPPIDEAKKTGAGNGGEAGGGEGGAGDAGGGGNAGGTNP
jgi:hypothetical protein